MRAAPVPDDPETPSMWERVKYSPRDAWAATPSRHESLQALKDVGNRVWAEKTAVEDKRCFVKAAVKLYDPKADLYIVGMGDQDKALEIAKTNPKRHKKYEEYVKRSCSLASDSQQLLKSMALVLQTISKASRHDDIQLYLPEDEQVFATWSSGNPNIVEPRVGADLASTAGKEIRLQAGYPRGRFNPFGEMTWSAGSDQINLKKLALLGATGVLLARNFDLPSVPSLRSKRSRR